MVTLHFFVGTFSCLVHDTVEQQPSNLISGPCNVDNPLVGFCTNLVPNVCCITSVEGLALNYYIFNVSWQTIIRGSGDIRSTRHFENVCTGILVFTTISISSRTYLALLRTSYTKNQIDSSSSSDSLKKLFQGTELVYSLSNSI